MKKDNEKIIASKLIVIKDVAIKIPLSTVYSILCTSVMYGHMTNHSLTDNEQVSDRDLVLGL